MTNLKKGSSHDFDLLAENKGLALGDSESGLTLVLQKFEPYPIEITIIPAVGRARIRYRELFGEFEIEIPLGIFREQEIPFEMSLGIPRFQSDFTISMPLAREIQQVLDVLIPIHTKPEQIKILVPLKGKPKYEVYFKGKPKSKRKVVATLKALSKLLKEE